MLTAVNANERSPSSASRPTGQGAMWRRSAVGTRGGAVSAALMAAHRSAFV
jgi:hypothetical protein